jgi:hypothetical protein
MALYNRGMAVEEQFRNTKGCRFEVRLEWTPFRTPASLVRVTRLVNVAQVLWTAVGQAVATTTPGIHPPCKHKGPRLFLLRVGNPYVAELALLIYIGVRCIQAHLPRLGSLASYRLCLGLKRHHTLCVKSPLTRYK